MQGEVYRVSMQSMWPVVVVHLMGIGCLNSKPPETVVRKRGRIKMSKKRQMSGKNYSDFDIEKNQVEFFGRNAFQKSKKIRTSSCSEMYVTRIQSGPNDL